MTSVGVLIFDKSGFKPKLVRSDKEAQFIDKIKKSMKRTLKTLFKHSKYKWQLLSLEKHLYLKK